MKLNSNFFFLIFTIFNWRKNILIHPTNENKQKKRRRRKCLIKSLLPNEDFISSHGNLGSSLWQNKSSGQFIIFEGERESFHKFCMIPHSLSWICTVRVDFFFFFERENLYFNKLETDDWYTSDAWRIKVFQI